MTKSFKRTKNDLISKQMRFIRQACHSKTNIIRNWPRRVGKTYTLNKLAKAKGFQYIKYSSTKINKSTRVILLDDFQDDELIKIKEKWPSLRLVAIHTPKCTCLNVKQRRKLI